MHIYVYTHIKLHNPLKAALHSSESLQKQIPLWGGAGLDRKQ